jgi:hypothetical protein
LRIAINFNSYKATGSSITSFITTSGMHSHELKGVPPKEERIAQRLREAEELRKVAEENKKHQLQQTEERNFTWTAFSII